MKLNQAYVAGRVIAKIAGLEVDNWREMNHEAHVQCMTLALEVVPDPDALEIVVEECLNAFRTGDLKKLRSETVDTLVGDSDYEGLDEETAKYVARGVISETLNIRRYIHMI